MITFCDHDSQVVLEYSPDQPVGWVDESLKTRGYVRISHVFTVSSDDLVVTIDQNFDDSRRFTIGRFEGGYRIIRKEVLSLQHDLMIAASVPLTRATFVAERNISIFKRIDDLVSQQIVIGGQNRRRNTGRRVRTPTEEISELR